MKENERAELEKMEKLRKTIEASPLTQQIIQEKAAAILGERLLVAAKLRTTFEETEKVIPKRQQEVDARVEDLVEYDEGRKAVLDKLTFARVELMKERQRLDWEQSHAEAALLSNYDPRIDEGIQFWRGKFEELRKGTVNRQKHAESNVETKTITTFSNADSIRQALAYCMAAIRQLEAMRLEPVFDPTKIERLRAEEPDANLWEEFSTTKGRHNDEPRPGLLSAIRQASEEISDLTVKTLLEKAKKILAPKRAGARA